MILSKTRAFIASLFKKKAPARRVATLRTPAADRVGEPTKSRSQEREALSEEKALDDSYDGLMWIHGGYFSTFKNGEAPLADPEHPRPAFSVPGGAPYVSPVQKERDHKEWVRQLREMAEAYSETFPDQHTSEEQKIADAQASKAAGEKWWNDYRDAQLSKKPPFDTSLRVELLKDEN